MKYLEQLLDALIKWEGQKLEINLLEPPFVFKDNKKNFLTKVPFTDSEFNLIEYEYKEEFSGQTVFAYKDHYITTSRTEKARIFSLEMEADKTVDLTKLIQLMTVKKATDLHLTPRCKPMMRIDGEMEMLEESPPLSEEKLREELLKIVPAQYLQHFKDRNEICFVQELERSRIRIHLFRDRRGLSAVFRKIPLTYIIAAELGVPQQIIKLCRQPKGLILVTGGQGSGKTTTLASLVDAINRSQKRHVIVLEHPIEYIHWNKLSLIHQKECAKPDCISERDLADIWACDADVVALGEIKSAEMLHRTMEIASCGHLVIGTIPTLSAIGTIEHIIEQFHSGNKPHVRSMLAGCLLGILSQVLCRTKSGGGRVVAFEALTVTPAVANLIREGKTYQLATLMQPGNSSDNRLLNEVLIKLVESGVIDPAEALFRAYDAEGIKSRLKLKGTGKG